MKEQQKRRAARHKQKRRGNLGISIAAPRARRTMSGSRPLLLVYEVLIAVLEHPKQYFAFHESHQLCDYWPQIPVCKKILKIMETKHNFM
ncbi:hypothetical protein AV530_000744 [Patagioenas fasciata monilis]|uniref:Uncharacterized protein n=1 Tax=Patagioenas fasciata monilis TaxID=372326 RepID=A0A1V4KS40_PATFA|nr:hypothetical protein AV530_000744 [Patagioenas fasciata monilis]